MSAVLWAIHRALVLIAWHVVKLRGDDPGVREELDAAVAEVESAITNHEGR
jgi:hypothetical protein